MPCAFPDEGVAFGAYHAYGGTPPDAVRIAVWPMPTVWFNGVQTRSPGVGEVLGDAGGVLGLVLGDAGGVLGEAGGGSGVAQSVPKLMTFPIGLNGPFTT